MRAGEFADGARVLRLKIDMSSPNINLRDPVAYRIRHAHHHRTGDKWCIYPLYDYTHGISDALEHITHSICTLEFEDHRPLYDWINDRLADFGLLARPLPQQIEFARLNLTYVVLSKRKLIQLVEDGHVDGWDDPRMPTIVGFRRRGFTPESIRLFAERIGVSKADSWIDMTMLEDCLREDLNERAPRATAVLDPLKLVIDNYPEGKVEEMEAPVHPQKPELGKRKLPFARELWIEREDFMESPPKGYFRLYPGNMVRLRYGYVVKCTGFEKDASRERDRGALRVPARLALGHRRQRPVQGEGQHPLGEREARVRGGGAALRPALRGAVSRVAEGDASRRVARPVEVDETGKVHAAEMPEEYNWLDDINPDSKKVITAYLEPGLQGREARRSLPVRAPRLLRRRSARLEPRQAGVQPRGDAAGFVGESV